MNGQLLIVEDDDEIASLLKSFLEEKGYQTSRAADGISASSIMKSRKFSLILMDMMLPHKSGGELIAELRAYSDTPVIVISAKSAMETRLEVLRIGADDYILKPFDLNEVLVRIEVVIRRSGSVCKKDVLSYNGIELDLSANTASCCGKTLSLTAKELSLLKLFLENPKKVFTKANLYESVWQDTYYYEDNTVNVHISNLRSKLKKASGRDHIETVWGIGYRMKEE
ncbi:MAG: response regulator transcription factor [Oscillospiraceae bacterium]